MFLREGKTVLKLGRLGVNYEVSRNYYYTI
jgi:hypothetical protein